MATFTAVRNEKVCNEKVAGIGEIFSAIWYSTFILIQKVGKKDKKLYSAFETAECALGSTVS